MRSSDIPNFISVARIVLVVPLVLALLAHEYVAALILFVVAGTSDGLDGFLAKRYGWTSRLGSILDPIADKLLLVSCYLVLSWLAHIPLWLVSAVIIRDIVIFVGALAFHRYIGNFDLIPSFISKVNTFAQLVCGFLVMLSLAWLQIEPKILETMFQIVFATTVLSGGDYVWTWGHKAWQARRARTRL